MAIIGNIPYFQTNPCIDVLTGFESLKTVSEIQKPAVLVEVSSRIGCKMADSAVPEGFSYRKWELPGARFDWSLPKKQQLDVVLVTSCYG